MPIPWPLITGLLSVGGTIMSNRQNKKQAREAMAFSERMSSTAAQRSVADYTAAGLNPALAYDRSASSPTGTMVGQGDPVNSGISTALGAKRQQLEMENLRADYFLKTKQAVREHAQGDLADAQARGQTQANIFTAAQQPASLRTAIANAITAEAGTKGAEARSKLWQTGSALFDTAKEGYQNIGDYWNDKDFWRNQLWSKILPTQTNSARSYTRWLQEKP